ncbi:MAG: penicillin-binding transpeptidase domain-containing protein [Oscillospiraceae bacterium]
MRSFGLLEGSGIDLAGEATGIFMAQSDFSQLDLACYAFGQNFNVTPISLIAAQAACINGGYLPAMWWSRSGTAAALWCISTTTPPCVR